MGKNQTAAYVLPEWRRQGLARQLLAAVLTAAKHPTTVHAFVLKGNRYLRVWLRMRFSIARELPKAYEIRRGGSRPPGG